MQGGWDQAGAPGMVAVAGCRHRKAGFNSPSGEQTEKNWIDLTRNRSLKNVLVFFNHHGIDEVPLNSPSVLLGPAPAHANTPRSQPGKPPLLCWALKTAPLLMSALAPLPPPGQARTCSAFRAAPWRWSRIKLSCLGATLPQKGSVSPGHRFVFVCSLVFFAFNV